MTVIFAIDTSCSGTYLSLKVGDKIISASNNLESKHSEEIATLAASLKLDSYIGGINSPPIISIGTGPGSFTGLRISMSFVKGLAMALKSPVLSFSSFLAVAATTVTEKKYLAILGDAGRGEIFFGLFNQVAPQKWKHSAQVIITLESEVEGILSELNISKQELRIVDLRTEKVDLSLGLVNLCEDFLLQNTPQYNIEQIVSLEPTYIRAVSFQTVQERQNS